MNRPLLILDLDETLVWGTEAEPADGYDFQVSPYWMTRRPYLDTFLDRVSNWFDLAVWTSSGGAYTSAVVARVFADRPLQFAWARSRCTLRFNPETREPYWLKNLEKVGRRGFDLDRVLVIDDSPEKLERHRGNLLCLRPFEGQPDDRELLEVLPYLEWLQGQTNFRCIDKSNWRAVRRGG